MDHGAISPSQMFLFVSDTDYTVSYCICSLPNEIYMNIPEMLWVVVLTATNILADKGVYEVTGGGFRILYVELEQLLFYQKLGGPRGDPLDWTYITD